jgi:arsenate reductase
MEEAGVDISTQTSKSLDSIPMNEIDLVVTLGTAQGKCPSLPKGIRLDHWSIPDLNYSQGGEAAVRTVLRCIRDEIDRKVAALFLDCWRNVA